MSSVLSLTTILIPDSRSTGFAGYFAEFPELLAQGETKEELQRNLLILAEMLKYKKDQVLFSHPNSEKAGTLNLVTA